jgi:hypothetical protein
MERNRRRIDPVPCTQRDEWAVGLWSAAGMRATGAAAPMGSCNGDTDTEKNGGADRNQQAHVHRARGFPCGRCCSHRMAGWIIMDDGDGGGAGRGHRGRRKWGEGQREDGRLGEHDVVIHPGRLEVDNAADRPRGDRECGRGEVGRDHEIVRTGQEAVRRCAALAGGSGLAAGQGEGECARCQGGETVDEVLSWEFLGARLGIGILLVGAGDSQVRVIGIARVDRGITRLELGKRGRLHAKDLLAGELLVWDVDRDGHALVHPHAQTRLHRVPVKHGGLSPHPVQRGEREGRREVGGRHLEIYITATVGHRHGVSALPVSRKLKGADGQVTAAESDVCAQRGSCGSVAQACRSRVGGQVEGEHHEMATGSGEYRRRRGPGGINCRHAGDLGGEPVTTEASVDWPGQSNSRVSQRDDLVDGHDPCAHGRCCHMCAGCDTRLRHEQSQRDGEGEGDGQ